ncbi:DnaB-like helicase C-terminal domain-containing protein [Gemmatimonas sp.]|uniref:DnaB-like helicase C-terminal domain-containing protein n=1 Tax=Gemmatimonas sp. TaxID=1962908 RepID=UPI003567C28D
MSDIVISTPAGRRPIEAMWRRAGDVAREALAVTELRTEYPDLIGLQTGIAQLDTALRGELEPGHVIVIAGGSGDGKTTLCAQAAASFATQVPTYMLSLEDEVRDITNRVMANISSENVRELRTGFESGTVPQTVRDALVTMDGLTLDLNDGIVHPRVEQLAAIIGAWAQSQGEQRHLAVIIDQLGHIAPSRASDDFWRLYPHLPAPPSNQASHEMLEWQVMYLQAVAKKYHITMVIAHQLNDRRDEGSKKPDLSSVRGSRGITHKADCVLVPWVPKQLPNEFAGVGDPKFLDNTSKHGEILILKGRHVPLADIGVMFDGGRQRFVARALGTNARWSAAPAKTARQIAGGSKLAALLASFDVLAEARYEVTKALPAGSADAPVIDVVEIESSDADDAWDEMMDLRASEEDGA